MKDQWLADTNSSSEASEIDPFIVREQTVQVRRLLFLTGSILTLALSGRVWG